MAKIWIGKLSTDDGCVGASPSTDSSMVPAGSTELCAALSAVSVAVLSSPRGPTEPLLHVGVGASVVSVSASFVDWVDWAALEVDRSSAGGG